MLVSVAKNNDNKKKLRAMLRDPFHDTILYFRRELGFSTLVSQCTKNFISLMKTESI